MHLLHSRHFRSCHSSAFRLVTTVFFTRCFSGGCYPDQLADRSIGRNVKASGHATARGLFRAVPMPCKLWLLPGPLAPSGCASRYSKGGSTASPTAEAVLPGFARYSCLPVATINGEPGAGRP